MGLLLREDGGVWIPTVDASSFVFECSFNIPWTRIVNLEDIDLLKIFSDWLIIEFVIIICFCTNPGHCTFKKKIASTLCQDVM